MIIAKYENTVENWWSSWAQISVSSLVTYSLIKIYLSKPNIADCLEYIDNMGFIVVVISEDK